MPEVQPKFKLILITPFPFQTALQGVSKPQEEPLSLNLPQSVSCRLCILHQKGDGSTADDADLHRQASRALRVICDGDWWIALTRMW